jgi:hypothetical protein
MTTSRHITPAGITALAAFIHTDIRPDWHRRGIAATLHNLTNLAPPDALAIALIRGALDPANDTPTAIEHLNNRAWTTDAYPPCPTHPNASRRTSGECGGCYADRTADDTSTSERRPTPPSKPLRELVNHERSQREEHPETP